MILANAFLKEISYKEIVESLVNVKDLVGKRFFFSAVPLKFADGDGSPVRAYAITED